MLFKAQMTSFTEMKNFWINIGMFSGATVYEMLAWHRIRLRHSGKMNILSRNEQSPVLIRALPPGNQETGHDTLKFICIRRWWTETFWKRKCLPKYPPCGNLLNVPDLLVDVWPVRRLVEAFDVGSLHPQRCWIKQRLLYCRQYVAKMTFRLILLFSPDTLQSDSSLREALERRNLKEK